jgi:predicted small lipoprotein YifL
MRVFYRSAPVFMALSVALAGCGESNPGATNSAGGSANTQASSAGAASATADPNATEVCLTVDGMT